MFTYFYGSDIHLDDPVCNVHKGLLKILWHLHSWEELSLKNGDSFCPKLIDNMPQFGCQTKESVIQIRLVWYYALKHA